MLIDGRSLGTSAFVESARLEQVDLLMVASGLASAILQPFTSVA